MAREASKSLMLTAEMPAAGRPEATSMAGMPASITAAKASSESHSGAGRITPSIPPRTRCAMASRSFPVPSHCSITSWQPLMRDCSRLPSNNSLR